MTSQTRIIFENGLIDKKPKLRRASEGKECLRIQSAHLFCCSRSGVQSDVENCLMQLYVGPCYVVSAETAMAMAVPIENPADCEVRGVISFCRPMKS